MQNQPLSPKEDKALKMLLWLVAVGFFMQTLDATIVNTALPAMAVSLGESPLHMHSVVISYSLAMAAVIPASGWLADRFGNRRVFFSAILLFSLGSLFCAVSSTLMSLVISRVVQGVGGALLLPVGRLAVLRAFPRERFLVAMSFVTVPGMIGPLVGPSLGGWLVEYASWPWVFLINLPLGLLGCVMTRLYMPGKTITSVVRFDTPGYLLLTCAMVSISFSLDGFSYWGLAHAGVFVLLVFGLVSFTAYWLRAVKHPAPLFPMHMFSVDTFRIGLLGNLFARIGCYAMPFLIPLLLQVGLGYSPAQAGAMLIPGAIAAILIKRAAPALIGRYGYRTVLIVNTVLVGHCIGAFFIVDAGLSPWILLALLALFGAINSLQFTAMNTITLGALEGSLASSGNSMLSMVMMLSMSLGVSVAGGLLTGFGELFGATQLITTFHASFLCLGLMTCASTWIFWQLAPDTDKLRPQRNLPEAN